MKIITRIYVSIVTRDRLGKTDVYYVGDDLAKAKGVVLDSDYSSKIEVWENGKYINNIKQ